MNFKKVVSLIAAMLFLFNCVPAVFVSAAEPWEDMEARYILSNLSSADNTDKEGYFHSIQDKTLLSGNFIRITYSISGTYTDSTEPFILKPFNTEWGGWDDNFVSVGSSQKTTDNEYTAYISVADITASLSSGTLAGINIYFNKNESYTITVNDLSMMFPKVEEPEVTEANYTVNAQEVTVRNVGNAATLIVALYKDDVLLDAKQYPGSGTITAPYAADMTEALKSATNLKAFVWNNISGIAPKGASYVTAISSLGSKEKSNLELSIKYCDNMIAEKYQPESWATFTSALDKAKSSLNTLTTDKQYADARQTLENAKSKLLFADSTDPGNPLPFRILSKDDVVYEMGVGWNLGNTLDGHAGFHPGETSWQQFVTTKELIRSLHDYGYNTIRIPVTWGDMIDDKNDYAINDAWLSRVQDIVDYCVEMDMYAIINIHHDGAEQDGWLRVAADDIDSVFEKFEGVWRNIAERFKDYDEHLIFESANELTCMAGDDKNSAAAQEKDTPIIMNLNQIFVNVVRSTDSNNKHRWLAAVSHYANRGTSNGFALPSDSYNSNNRIMFAQHIYKATNQDTWAWADAKQLVDVVKQSRNKFKNAPIILGEYGTRNRKYASNPSGFNDIGRAYYYECATRAGQVGATVPCVWDDSRGSGADAYETGVYTIWDREKNAPLFKSISDAMMRGMFLTPSSKNKSYDMSDIKQNPTITNITEITPSMTEVTAEVGSNVKLTADIKPESCNDVVLWKSDDDNIATVYRGIVTGSRIGSTYITAFSQSGSAETKIKVNILPKTSANPAKSITVEKELYKITEGEYEFINAAADNSEQLLYSISNENIASVSALGKITALKPGKAYITITAESGVTKTVPLEVTSKSSENKLNIAACIYFNGSYIGTERTAPIEVIGDGQYSVKFDTASDLSAAAKNAGLKYLKDIGSLYFKDYDADVNGAQKSPIDGCEIRYDEIKVNGTPLTITKTDFKSAMKGDVFDSGDPLNAWDGSAVSDNDITTDKKKYRINFKTIAEPTTIEIKFTIRNLEFTKTESENEVAAAALTANGNTTFEVAGGTSGSIAVNATPSNSTSLISFVSSNKSVVMVNEKAKPLSGGTAEAEFTALNSGTAVITAISDSGAKTTFTITVK